MEFEGDHTARVPAWALPIGITAFRVEGITAFRVEGVLDDAPAEALWDGQRLCVSGLLYERGALVTAVEEIFDEPKAAGDGTWTAGRSAEEIMLTLVTSCDFIISAEYELNGHRRAISI